MRNFCVRGVDTIPLDTPGMMDPPPDSRKCRSGGLCWSGIPAPARPRFGGAEAAPTVSGRVVQTFFWVAENVNYSMLINRVVQNFPKCWRCYTLWAGLKKSGLKMRGNHSYHVTRNDLYCMIYDTFWFVLFANYVFLLNNYWFWLIWYIPIKSLRNCAGSFQNVS